MKHCGKTFQVALLFLRIIYLPQFLNQQRAANDEALMA
jgi:hypothetical protein